MIYKITPSGEKVRIAGRPYTDGWGGWRPWMGEHSSSADGSPAADAMMCPKEMTFVPESGELYYIECSSQSLKRINQHGYIYTVAGGGDEVYSGTSNVELSDLDLVYVAFYLIAPDGKLFIAANKTSGASKLILKIDKVDSLLQLDSFMVVEPSGGYTYEFDQAGRHRSTTDTQLSQVFHQFEYDESGNLNRLTDRHGNTTTIERSWSGTPTAITGPFGQRTELSVNDDGYLKKVTMPTGKTHTMVYSSDGLLLEFTSPRGYSNIYDYDEIGRLKRDVDPLGGGWSLDRSQDDNGLEVTMTSGEGRTNRFRVESQPSGRRLQVDTSPDGSTRTPKAPTVTPITVMMTPLTAASSRPLPPQAASRPTTSTTASC